MITKEQAIKIAQRSGQTSGFHIFDIYNIIDEIFDDIGSCGECKFWLQDKDYTPCALSGEYKAEKGFCDEFERKEL